jgi:hypothetical protein
VPPAEAARRFRAPRGMCTRRSEAPLRAFVITCSMNADLPRV